MKRILACLILGSMFLGLSAGCGRAVRELVSGTLVEPLAKPAITPASEAEVQVFVDALTARAQKGDAKAICDLFDWDTLGKRAMQGLRVQQNVFDSWKTGATNAAIERGLPAQLATVSAGAASLKYLGAETRNGELWQTFRFRPADGGFDHLSLLVGRGAGAQARAMDFELMTSGEPISAIVRRVMLPLLATDKDSVLARLAGKDAAFVKHSQTVTEIQKLAAAGEAKKALAMFDRLPADLRGEKWIMLQRLNVASSVDDGAYQKAIEALRKAYPNDASTAVHMIDGFLLAKRYDDALSAVDAVEKGAMRDAFFDYTRGNVLYSAERLPEAKASFAKAVAAEPDLVDAHWSLVSVSLKQRDFAETTRLLLSMRTQFSLSYELEGVEEYAEYVKSPEYPKLLAATGG